MNLPRYNDFDQDLNIYYCTRCHKQFYYYEELEDHKCEEEPQKLKKKVYGDPHRWEIQG